MPSQIRALTLIEYSNDLTMYEMCRINIFIWFVLVTFLPIIARFLLLLLLVVVVSIGWITLVYSYCIWSPVFRQLSDIFESSASFLLRLRRSIQRIELSKIESTKIGFRTHFLCASYLPSNLFLAEWNRSMPHNYVTSLLHVLHSTNFFLCTQQIWSTKWWFQCDARQKMV